MMKKFVFGNPLETEAMTDSRATPGSPAEEAGSVPYLSVSGGSEGESCVLTYDMGERDIIYGLGENVRGINKRGWIYESNCTDDPLHTETRRELYAAHNFFIVDGRERFGVFVDAPQKVTFDFGYENRDGMKITVSPGGFVLYILEIGRAHV